MHDNAGLELSSDATLVSEVLAGEGFRTGAFVGAHVLDRRFGLDQGFEVYRGPAGQGLGTVPMVRRPASDVVDDAIAWLESVEPTERYLVWLHLYDPHEVPEPPEPWRSRLPDRYDALAFADAEPGRLLDFLDDRRLSDGLLTVVTADHGESLGDAAEQNGLAEADSERVEQMERELDLLRSNHEPLDGAVQRSLTQRDEEALRALGYAVGASRGDPFAAQLADTRDRLGDLRMIDRVHAMLERRRALLRKGEGGLARAAAIDARAHALLEEIWQRNPGDPDVAPMLAATSRRRGDAARAAEIMQATVVLRPTSATLQLGLARDYLALSRPEGALRAITRAVELEPGYLAAYVEAIAHYRGSGDPQGEAAWLRRLAVQLDVASDAHLAVEGRLDRLTGVSVLEIR